MVYLFISLFLNLNNMKIIFQEPGGHSNSPWRWGGSSVQHKEETHFLQLPGRILILQMINVCNLSYMHTFSTFCGIFLLIIQHLLYSTYGGLCVLTWGSNPWFSDWRVVSVEERNIWMLWKLLFIVCSKVLVCVEILCWTGWITETKNVIQIKYSSCVNSACYQMFTSEYNRTQGFVTLQGCCHEILIVIMNECSVSSTCFQDDSDEETPTAKRSHGRRGSPELIEFSCEEGEETASSDVHSEVSLEPHPCVCVNCNIQVSEVSLSYFRKMNWTAVNWTPLMTRRIGTATPQGIKAVFNPSQKMMESSLLEKIFSVV